MPGYELINKKEYLECKEVLLKSKTFFRMGFEKNRKNIYKVAEFEKKFKNYIKSRYCLAVTSGTAALRVALACLNLKKGDEVITQAFTFVATVEAIVESGCKPVYANIDLSLNLDPKDLEKKITNKTKAVILVHMLGAPGKISEIKKICKKNKIYLIEDTAWGCGGKYKKKFLGNIGDIGTFSFDHAKAITTGEGGMLSFKNKKLFNYAKAWHDHGHENNPKFNRWEDTRKSSGFNFRMNELQGAIGLAQLSKLKYLIKMQRKNYFLIWEKIKKINNIFLRQYDKSAYISADALIFLTSTKKIAKKCRIELLKYNISTKILPEAFTWHFAGSWKHIPQAKHFKNINVILKKSKKILSKAVSIPIFAKMKEEQIYNIYNAIKKATI